MIILLYYGLGLLCLTRFLTIFQLYRGVSLIGGGNEVQGEIHRPVASH